MIDTKNRTKYEYIGLLNDNIAWNKIFFTRLTGNGASNGIYSRRYSTRYYILDSICRVHIGFAHLNIEISCSFFFFPQKTAASLSAPSFCMQAEKTAYLPEGDKLNIAHNRQIQPLEPPIIKKKYHQIVMDITLLIGRTDPGKSAKYDTPLLSAE